MRRKEREGNTHWEKWGKTNEKLLRRGKYKQKLKIDKILTGTVKNFKS